MTGMIYNIIKNPKELKPHKTNTEIYGAEIVDDDLVDSIQKKGILEPIVILEDNTILSGHRRWLAAKQLKLEHVPCRSMSFSDELDEKEALIEFNRQRKKTHSQRMNEADMIQDIVKSRNKAKQSELARGTHLKESDKQVSLISDTPDTKKDITVPVDKIDIIPNVSKGRSDAEIASKIGISRDKYTKEKRVWDVAKTGDTYAKSLVEKLDKEYVSTNEAANRIKIYQEAPEPVKKKIIEEDLTAKEASIAIKENIYPGMSDKTRKVLFSSEHDNWGTPKEIYDTLNKEFKFEFDPCPLNSEFDGLLIPWKGNVFVNPPYSNIGGFLEKGHKEIKNGNAKKLVFLIPSRTDTKWFHTFIYPQFKRECEPYADIRFIKGRIKFTNGDQITNSAPFPSMIVIIGVD